MFAAASAAGVGALVYASSVGAYSPGPGRRVDESWPTHSVPTAAYGREKAYVERLLDTFEARHPDIRVVRLRPAFIFQRQAASQKRRIFAGPLRPNALVRPSRLPVVPWPAGLRFQALHANDVAEAYRLAVVGDARGAYNVAADPVINAESIGEVVGSRVVLVPGRLARAGLTAAWQLHHSRPSRGCPTWRRTSHCSTPRGSAPSSAGPHRVLRGGTARGARGDGRGSWRPNSTARPDSPAGWLHEGATGAGERRPDPCGMRSHTKQSPAAAATERSTSSSRYRSGSADQRIAAR